MFARGLAYGTRINVYTTLLYAGTTRCLSIPVSKDTGCLLLLAIVNDAPVKPDVQITCPSPFLQFWGHIPRSGTAGFHGNFAYFF